MAARHYKYFYKNELPPKAILKKMIRTNIEDIYNTNEEPNKIDFTNERNKLYFNRRKYLKNLIKSLNTYISNSSQSLFLTFYFMDSIFTNNNLENIFFNHFNILEYLIPLKDIQMNNYALLSVACLIISYKFNENDPKIPSMSSFVKMLYHFSKKNFFFSENDLAIAEVVAIKILKYKLNYYTIYHFFVFFFTHGVILKKTIQNSNLSGKFSEKKILEKIYIEGREILDWIVDSEEYYNYYFGKDNHIIVVEILLWSMEHILGMKIQDSENIFKLIYNIKINEEKHLKIYGIIEKLYLLKKGNIEYNNRPIFINKNYQKKLLTYNNPLTYTTIENNTKSNYNYNYNSIQASNSITSSYNNIYNTLSFYEDSFSLYNKNIHNEIDKFKTNYPYQYDSNKPTIVEKVQGNKVPKLNDLKTPNFYNNNKGISSPCDINSIIPIKSNLIQSVPNYSLVTKTENYVEREPTDSKRIINTNKNTYTNTNNNEIKEIENIQAEKIYLDNISTKIKKTSLSCNKKENSIMKHNFNEIKLKSSFAEGTNDMNYYTTINNTIYDTYMNAEDELQLEEKINIPRVFNNKVKMNMNNYIYRISSNKPIQNKIKNKYIKDKDKEKNKETLFKKYQRAVNEYNPKLVNKKDINENKHETKIKSNQELINKTKTLYTVTKINQTMENEPRDSKKRSINNKLKKKNEINTNNITDNNSINKHNTIIINNNININTYIDNNKAIDKKNSNIFMYNSLNNNNMSQILDFPNLNNKYKNIIKRQPLLLDLKDGQNIINKSDNLVDGLNNINSFNFNTNY